MTRSTWAIVIVAAIVITTVGLMLANARGKTADVSVIGCLELEEDYRARTDDKPDVGAEAGIDDPEEFVLSDAAPAAGLNKNVGVASAYRLSGELEEGLVRQVGRRVELVGTVKAMDARPAAPADADDLPELAVNLWRPSEIACASGAAPVGQ